LAAPSYRRRQRRWHVRNSSLYIDVSGDTFSVRHISESLYGERFQECHSDRCVFADVFGGKELRVEYMMRVVMLLVVEAGCKKRSSYFA
jgi:hypothetical protein